MVLVTDSTLSLVARVGARAAGGRVFIAYKVDW
jgi:hypothetical protein